MAEHIVDFHKWCKTCLYYDLPEEEDPCWDCLAATVNEDSRKPVKYQKDPSKSDS